MMMKHILLSALTLGAMTSFALAQPATPADARSEPIKLTSAQMDNVTAGAIVQVNGGGNTPQGNANGIPSTNPAGQAPPGQNK
jgi:hypothetical protein